MANKRWKGGAQATAQVNTITPALVDIGDTFTVTINSKTVTFTATAATVANVTAGLVALLNASTEGEFAEITWADITTAITGTADTKGKPFTQTSSSVGGTLTTSTTTANVSPNDVNNATNWSPSGVPVATDTIYIDNTSVSLLWNLEALTGLTMTAINIELSFTGQIGLSETNTDGTAYKEYRPQYLAVGATTLNIGNGVGPGSGMIKINGEAIATTLNQVDSGTSQESDREAVLWKGSNAANVVNITGGSLGIAIFGDETATVATIRMASGLLGAPPPTVRCGAGVTLTTIDKESGTLTINSGLTTLTNRSGDAEISAGNITTLTVAAGTVSYRGVGTITTANISGGATLDFSGDVRARTLTNTNMYSGARLHDPASTVTFTNAIQPQRCDISDLILYLGKNRAFLPS